MGEDSDAEPTSDGSRRTFLRAMGATSALAGVGLAGAQETTTESGQTTTEQGQTTTETGQQTTTVGEATPIVLGGRVPYWFGLAPVVIEGQQNPTLGLRAGEQYRLVWMNADGERHQWRIEDGEGNALARTDPARRVGATRSVTFEATEAMARYRCAFHPEQMRGSVEIGAGFETTAEGETTTEGGQTTEEGQTTEGDQTTATGGAVVEVAVGPEENTLRFVPEEVEISVGDTVRWTARSSGHNVSFKPEADPKVEIPEGAEPFATYEGNRSFMILGVGETFEHTFTVPGTYVYVCVPHADQGMVGRVVVTE